MGLPVEDFIKYPLAIQDEELNAITSNLRYIEKEEFYRKLQFSYMPKGVGVQCSPIEGIPFCVQIENGRELKPPRRKIANSCNKLKYKHLNIYDEHPDESDDGILVRGRNLDPVKRSKSYDSLPFVFKRRDQDLYKFKLQKILSDADFEVLKAVSMSLYEKLERQLLMNQEEYNKLKNQYVKEISKFCKNSIV